MRESTKNTGLTGAGMTLISAGVGVAVLAGDEPVKLVTGAGLIVVGLALLEYKYRRRE